MNELIQSGKAESIQMLQLTKAFAMDSILKYVFSIEVDSMKQWSEPLVSNMWKLIHFPSLPLTLSVMLPVWMSGLLTPWMSDRRAGQFYTQMSLNIIKQRRANPQVRYNDFLDILIEGENDLSDQELADHCLVVFLGGVDTVSRALCFLIADLAVHQAAQQKVLTELHEKWEGEKLTYDTINELEYLNGFVMESMRMTSQNSRLVRYPSADYKLPGTELVVEKGTAIWISSYNIHHDESVYPQAYEFRPERFMGKEKEKQLSHAHLTFSGGSRNCAGLRLATLEIKYFLASLVQDYEIELAHDCKLPINFRPGVVPSVPDSLKMKFKLRN